MSKGRLGPMCAPCCHCDLAGALARQSSDLTSPPSPPSRQALILNDTSLGDEGVAAVCAALAAPGAAPELEVR